MLLSSSGGLFKGSGNSSESMGEIGNPRDCGRELELTKLVGGEEVFVKIRKGFEEKMPLERDRRRPGIIFAWEAGSSLTLSCC